MDDGSVFEGYRIGAEGTALGELVFSTSVVGYLEALTDPCYAGQILVQTFPLIGNYGFIPNDLEGDVMLCGYVVREICDEPSNFRAEGTLDAFLRENGICGICGVDTRQITRKIRENGVIKAMICDELPADQPTVELVPQKYTGCPKKKVYPSQTVQKYRITFVDYGTKHSTIEALTSRGCEVTVVPETASAEDILRENPDGVVLSAGPGDPSVCTERIDVVGTLIGKIPVLGIGLGHQLVALAMGGKTVRLPFGHRGGNQPVRECGTNRVLITSQNHGYAVDSGSLAGVAAELYVNANDGSCEGLSYNSQKCITVQFEPCEVYGARNPAALFDRFLSMLEV